MLYDNTCEYTLSFLFSLSVSHYNHVIISDNLEIVEEDITVIEADSREEIPFERDDKELVPKKKGDKTNRRSVPSIFMRFRYPCVCLIVRTYI